MKNYHIVTAPREFPWGKGNVVNLGEKGHGNLFSYVLSEPSLTGVPEEMVDIQFTKSGLPRIVSDNSPNNWLAYLSARGIKTRGSYGSIYVPKEQLSNITLHAAGSHTVEGWNEFLVQVKEGTLLWVRPVGGSHKIDRYYLYFSMVEVQKFPCDNYVTMAAGLHAGPAHVEASMYCDWFDLAVLAESLKNGLRQASELEK
jgi:hypothetical protein